MISASDCSSSIKKLSLEEEPFVNLVQILFRKRLRSSLSTTEMWLPLTIRWCSCVAVRDGSGAGGWTSSATAVTAANSRLVDRGLPQCGGCLPGGIPNWLQSLGRLLRSEPSASSSASLSKVQQSVWSEFETIDDQKLFGRSLLLSGPQHPRCLP